MELRACPGCRRHVAVDETSCPFCALALPPESPRVLSPGRLSRAAVFAGAALVTACGGKPKPTDTTTTTTHQADAGVDAAKPDAAVVPDHIQPMPYGAPPARRRIV
jgi:hypothetical protein